MLIIIARGRGMFQGEAQMGSTRIRDLYLSLETTIAFLALVKENVKSLRWKAEERRYLKSRKCSEWVVCN